MSKKNSGTNMKKLNKYVIIIILLAVIIMGGTYAKYVMEEKQETIYEAEAFYFESSKLSDGSPTPVYTLQKGLNTISIDLNNFVDSLRYSDVVISYTVSISDTSGNSVTDKNGARITEQTGSFAKAQKLTNNVSFTNLVSGTYTVTAQAVSPYTKTLRANFVITENDNEIEYTVSDVAGSSVAQLTVTTNEYSGNLVISWPAGLAPDSTDPKFSSVNTGFSAGSCTVNFETNSEYTFQFFKQNPSQKYTKSDISVVGE